MNSDLTSSVVENSAALVEELRNRACPAGLPYTGDDPDSDHGHTDCFLHRKSANHIEKCEFELGYIYDHFTLELTEAYAEISRLEKLITAWADADDACGGRRLLDVDSRSERKLLEAIIALREAIGR